MTWETSVVALVFIAVTLFFGIAVTLNHKVPVHVALKLLLFFAAMLINILGVNLAIEIAIANSAAADIQTVLTTIYTVNLYTLVLFTAYWILYYLYVLLMHFKQYGK